MGGMANMQKMPHVIESTLYTLNQSIFEPKGLQALSDQMKGGIVIFKKGNAAPQSQPQQPQQTQQTNEDLPPQYEEVQPMNGNVGQTQQPMPQRMAQQRVQAMMQQMS